MDAIADCDNIMHAARKRACISLCENCGADKELHNGTRAEEDAARRVQALCAFVRFADTKSLRAHVLRKTDVTR